MSELDDYDDYDPELEPARADGMGCLSFSLCLLLLFVAMPLLSACKTAHTADFLATPAERLVCEAAGTRPKIPAEYAIDWSKIATVDQARTEHDKYVAVIRAREGVVAAYVLQIEGKLFVCSNNAQWRRDYEAELAKSHSAVTATTPAG